MIFPYHLVSSLFKSFQLIKTKEKETGDIRRQTGRTNITEVSVTMSLVFLGIFSRKTVKPITELAKVILVS